MGIYSIQTKQKEQITVISKHLQSKRNLSQYSTLQIKKTAVGKDDTLICQPLGGHVKYI